MIHQRQSSSNYQFLGQEQGDRDGDTLPDAAQRLRPTAGRFPSTVCRQMVVERLKSVYQER